MRVVILRCWFLALCAAAALVPLLSRPALPASSAPPTWPATFEGRPLQAVPLSDLEQKFNAGFPGEIARFSDGRCEFIFRWITTGTRKLHPGADCFRGLGYSVETAPLLLDEHGARWSCFTATRGPHRLEVRERITSSAGAESWTDVSAWYWSTVLHQTRGPWLAITIVEGARR
ncbi:MAG: hypothetical protein QOE70_6062 [Chthoniobacter sp.]|jgi:hypothetical protein|nr:hypothetical protein [Chthoniobacter sp.]